MGSPDGSDRSREREYREASAVADALIASDWREGEVGGSLEGMRALGFLLLLSALPGCGDDPITGPNPFDDAGAITDTSLFGDVKAADTTTSGGCERFDYRASGKACVSTGCPAVRCECPGTFPRSISACTKQGCIVSANCAEVCGASSIGEAVTCTDSFGVGDAAPPPSDTGPKDTGCTPSSCSDLGKNCGTTDVGCGYMEDCGTCSGTNTCGGGGMPNVCGCTPTTCAAAGVQCGNVSDGCGSTLACTDTCTVPSWCGGGGIENTCGCMASGSLARTGTATASVPFTGSTRAWSGTASALLSDNQRAEISGMTSAQISEYLVVKGFGFKLPPNAVIAGVTMAVERSALSGVGIVDASVRLVKAAAIVGTDKATTTQWSTTDTTVSYGGATDLWATTWTPADVNSPDFGAAIAAKYTSTAGNDWARIDQIRITVHFTVPGC